jgi:hypothetical protein
MSSIGKKVLSTVDLDSQAVFELPAREMLSLITVVITNVLNNLSVDVTVTNNQVAVQICAAVQAINTIIAPTSLTCTIGQHH